MNLEEMRRVLDGLDKDLVNILVQRFDMSRQIGYFKRDHGLAVKDMTREDDLIRSRLEPVDDPELRLILEDLLRVIMDASCHIQETLVDPIKEPCV